VVHVGVADGGLPRVEVAAQHVDAEARAAFADITAQSHAVPLMARLGVFDDESLRSTTRRCAVGKALVNDAASIARGLDKIERDALPNILSMEVERCPATCVRAPIAKTLWAATKWSAGAPLLPWYRTRRPR